MYLNNYTAYSLNRFSTPPFFSTTSGFLPADVDASITVHQTTAIFPYGKSRGINSVESLKSLLHSYHITSETIGFHWEGNKVQGLYNKGYFLVCVDKSSNDVERLDLLVYKLSRTHACFSVVRRSCICPGGPNAPSNATTTIKLENVPKTATVFRLKSAAKPGGHISVVRIYLSNTTASLEFLHTPFTKKEVKQKEVRLLEQQRIAPRRRIGKAISLTANDIPTQKDLKKSNNSTNTNTNANTNSNKTNGWGKSGWKAKGTDGGNPSGRDRNVSRSRIFRKWLEETFGKERLLSGAGIMDVAGGKGELSWELQGYGEMPSTIVDPRPLDIVRMLKALTANKITRLRKDLKARVIDSVHLPLAIEVSLPLPKHVRCWFDYPLDSTKMVDKNITTYHEDELASNGIEEKKLLTLAKECAAVVGMHADQATEAIVDFGLSSGKPFAVVPCCVFPKMFKERKGKNGKEVKSYKEFIAYLESKGGVRIAMLPFPGRNVVVYGNV